MKVIFCELTMVGTGGQALEMRWVRKKWTVSMEFLTQAGCSRPEAAATKINVKLDLW